MVDLENLALELIVLDYYQVRNLNKILEKHQSPKRILTSEMPPMPADFKPDLTFADSQGRGISERTLDSLADKLGEQSEKVNGIERSNAI